MLGLNVQNFLSAATGMAVAIALVRAFTRRETDRIGNFWVDLTRSVVYILLPLSIVFSVILMSQGVVQSFSAYVDATTLEGAKQSLPLGPAASQIAIKQLGTNGGGFFGVNSAHPFENPTPLSNFLQVLAILLIPAALVHTFGRMVGNSRQGWSIFNAMLVLFVVGLAAALFFEYQPNPAQGGLPFLEGKELRFGIGNSALWATATTAASNGSVNAIHGSFSPIGGGVALVNMLLGEIVFGGVGAGLYGMLMYVLLAIFLAGLMVGRTPEYLGKKVEAREVILSATAVLVPSLIVLVFSAMALRTDLGLSSLTNRGPHGLSEVLYAFASAANNNGSAFGGLSANTNFYNALTGIAMLIGRFAVIIPVLAIAGGLAQKKKVAFGAGSFPTDTWLFTSLLVGVIVIVGALTFFPAVALGPIAEQLLLPSGKLF
jgi:K+-transporting ATPase ATPase A chain